MNRPDQKKKKLVKPLSRTKWKGDGGTGLAEEMIATGLCAAGMLLHGAEGSNDEEHTRSHHHESSEPVDDSSGGDDGGGML